MHDLTRPSEVDQSARPFFVQEGGQVVAASDPADVFDARLQRERRSEDRPNLAAVTSHRDFD